MTPQDTLALKANQNDHFNPFIAMEQAIYEDDDLFKQLEGYERLERQVCRQKSA